MANIGQNLADIGKAIGNGLAEVGTYSAKAAAQANSISAASQSAQGAFNQASANNANMLNENAMKSQWGFNSGQAAQANQLQDMFWHQAADWNEEMWEKQAAFNAEQAQINRDWQERMANTQYQRAVADMSKAGLNPILAVTGGGVGTGVPGGATASVGGAQMSSAGAQMASGSLLGANTASEGNYQGIMENMSSTLAILGAIFGGLSSASQAASSLPADTGEELMGGVVEMLTGWDDFTNTRKSEKQKAWDYINEDGIIKGSYNYYKNWWDRNGTNRTGGLRMTRAEKDQYLRYHAANNSTYKYTIPKG